MNGISAAALVLLAGLAAPAFAQSNVILPPFDGGGPLAKIATEDQALAALRQRGVMNVQRLGLVGDYWEGEGRLGGKPVVVYVFENGGLELRQASPGEHVRVPVQSAQTPQ